MKTGDTVLISPDLTKLPNWISGTVIEVENNPFVGIVISAETEDKNVFFGQQELFILRTVSFVQNENFVHLGEDILRWQSKYIFIGKVRYTSMTK